MSTTTTNYGLVKPELTDVADITAMNSNWDTIDTELKELNETIDNLDASDVGAYSKEEMDELLENVAPEFTINGKSPDETGEITLNASDVSALPIAGGTLTGDSLKIHNGDSEILSLTTGLSLITRTNKNSDDNRRRLILYNSTSTTDVSKAIRLLDTVDGTTKNYNLYGEHNITKGTTDLEAGVSELKSGCIHLVYE